MTLNNTDHKFDDVPVIDITPDNDDERTLLLNPDTRSTTPHVDTILVPSISRYRLTNILRILYLIEFLTLLIIWFVGTRHFFY